MVCTIGVKGSFTLSVSANAITLAMLSLKTMDTLQNRVATDFGVAPLVSMRTVSLASWQYCRSVDAGAWCKALAISLWSNFWLLTASVSVSVWVWVIWWITNQWHLEVRWFLIRQHFWVQILPIRNSADFLWENGWFLIRWCGNVALLFTCWIMNHHTSF